MPPQNRYFPQRATAPVSGLDPNLAAMMIAQRHAGWVPGAQPTNQPAVGNRYLDNENAPSLQGLSPFGRYNDMRMRRQALYASLIPNGTKVQDGTEVPMNAADVQQGQLDAGSGIGYGTDSGGNAVAITPGGGRITTIPFSDGIGASRLLESKYGTGTSVDTGTPGVGGDFPIRMSSGNSIQLPMSQWRTPQAQQLQSHEDNLAAHGIPSDDTADFQEMMDKLKAANVANAAPLQNRPK